MYLRGTTAWVYEILTGHLNGLVGFGELDGVNQALVPRLTVGIRHPHQVGGLWKKKNKTPVMKLYHHRHYQERKAASFCTCPAASVRPHRAFEAEPTQSPNDGTSPVLQF